MQHSITTSGVWTGKATAEMTFTPGIDGDIAHPTVHYSAAYAPRVYMGQAQSFHFRFTDHAERKSNDSNSVSAGSSFTVPVSIVIPKGYDQYDAILRGFGLEMDCDDSKQPNGSSCNPDSYSIWPTMLELDITQCTTIVGVMTCTMLFEVDRETPRGAIPDDFNWVVDYLVTVYFSVVAANNADANFVRSSRLVTEKSGIHNDAVVGTHSIRSKTLVNYDMAIVTLSGFGFRLGSLVVPHDGRNLYSYQFHVATGAINTTQSGSTSFTSDVSYSYTMGVLSPGTTAPEGSKLWHRTSLLQLASNPSDQYQTTLVLNQQVQGTVCQSDGILFECVASGVLFDHTSTSVKFSVEAILVPSNN
jgi:hypothetical protein